MITALNSLTAATQTQALSGAGMGSSSTSSTGFAAAFTGALGAGGATATASPFADLMTDAVGQVDKLDTQAHAAVAGLMSGSGVDVHTAMIATQKASMAFELALAVRNKAVQAYQSVIGMQF
jgi:flagellar hook-basal body complex protein FliE